MGKKTQKLQRTKSRLPRMLAVLAALCLLLGQMNLASLAAYATKSGARTFDVGGNVTARLEDGELTLAGPGGTDDFTAQTAPFLKAAGEIQTLVVEEGVTYLGAYLFYGLGGLEGELTLPESIVGFGDYAFSGESLQSAPRFSKIVNLFESGEVAKPVRSGPQTELSLGASSRERQDPGREDASQDAPSHKRIRQIRRREEDQYEDTPGIEAQVLPSPQASPTEPEQENEAASSSSGEEDDILSVTIEEPPTPLSAVPHLVTKEEETGWDSGETEGGMGLRSIQLSETTADGGPEENRDGRESIGFSQDMADDYSAPQPSVGASYAIEKITRQQIAHPDTLFYEGQDGVVLCSGENATFLEAALAAGYQKADRMVPVTLDSQVELELALVDGNLRLPECPEEITAPYDDDPLFTHRFAGWREAPDDPASPALAAGSLFAAGEIERLSLFSVWEPVGRYQPKIRTERDGDAARYTLHLDGANGTVGASSFYRLSYQWQIARRGDDGAIVWNDIDGATSAIYQRTVSPQESGLQLRCGVTALKLARSRSPDGPATLYSEPVNALAAINTVYVNQSAGDDANGDGTQEKPYQSLDKAAQALDVSGSVETNRIVIIGSYQLAEDRIFTQDISVPVTISGQGADSQDTLIGAQKGTVDCPVYLTGDLRLESIKVENINHIYGRGNNITIGENVSNNLEFYLYGSGQNALEGDGVGELAVYSGKIARIAGYVRSMGSVDVTGRKAHITVGGTAAVSTVVAGSASGGVKNADVIIDVTGGSVGTLIGGNQGFETALSPYTGKTAINISGGRVTNVLGAGTGRTVSIPTYSGQMEISVSGGTVGNIYGAGSAAYIVSAGDAPSSVDISVTGGTVGNIFAAGRGGDAAVGEQSGKSFPESTPPTEFGSLSGSASITVGGSAQITGSIYASGEGYQDKDYGKSNAYLSGKATITVTGNSIVKGDVYGGGKGIAKQGYEDCARVKAGSAVKVQIEGGVVEGNVYGGGETAKMSGFATVTLSDGEVGGNLYGGGKNGLTEGETTMEVRGGTVAGSVYGGALGTPGERLVYGGSTVNMTGGWIRGNLYGGSELSDDGPDSGVVEDLIFVNLAGGTVSGNVFGGGYRGIVSGSTHLHIGLNAPDHCAYYQGHPKEKPVLGAGPLSVDGSVYAGGDYGGGGTVNYDTITVEGTSHVYIDGTGYDTGAGGGDGMAISGGVFGSGASCDAGAIRLVTLKNYGSPVKTDGVITGATRTLAAVQRADRVLLDNSHVRLSGQSDVANANQTTLYSLNRIGDHGEADALGVLGNGLVLQDASTLVLDSAAVEIAGFKSVDRAQNEVTLAGLGATPNTVRFDSGTVFRVSYTPANAAEPREIYGPVSGYAYMLAGDTAEAYAYARVKTDTVNPDDGGFAGPGGAELDSHIAGDTYRYWQVKGANASAQRHTVLTAQTLESGAPGFDGGGYSVASGSVELPPVPAGSTYTIQSVTLPTGTDLTLVDAAKNGLAGGWVTSQDNGAVPGAAIDLGRETAAISASPLTTFGLFMRTGSGFTFVGDAPGKVISNGSAASGGRNSIVGQKTASATDGGLPQIDFYLTYWNEGITASKSLGTVAIVLISDSGAKTTMNVEIVTKASALSDQEVDLYATQSGSYAGRLIIPSGDNRSLRLAGVKTQAGSLVALGSALTGHQFTLAMQPVKSQGWSTAGLMDEAYDLGKYTAGQAVPIGTTDSRYQAPIDFTLGNLPGFTEKEKDRVVLVLEDDSGSAEITLNIHWKASAVSEVRTQPGRRYNGVTHQDAITVSPRSAVTAAFTMGGAERPDNLWLELRNASSGKGAALPAGTRLTLLGLSEFYHDTIDGSEADGKLFLSRFTAMWGAGAPTGNILAGTTLSVIVDFGQADASLAAGDYSLRLRSEMGADSQGANFTVANNGAAVGLSGGDGLSRGRHVFTLSVSANADMRLNDGAAVVLSPGSGEDFPQGTVFTLGGKEYYPSGGRAYLPLGPGKEQEILMDTTNSSGLKEGENTLTAAVFPTGQHAGAVSAALGSSSVVYHAAANPSYGLSVKLEDGGRIITAKAGQTQKLSFSAAYSVTNAGSEPVKIAVGVQKKKDGAYEDISPAWPVSGNSSISSGSGTQSLVVPVPGGLEPGTYRLVFSLGDQRAPYNVIVP